MTGRLSPVHMVRDLRFGLLIAGSDPRHGRKHCSGAYERPTQEEMGLHEGSEDARIQGRLNSALGFLIRLIYPQSSSLLLLVNLLFVLLLVWGCPLHVFQARGGCPLHVFWPETGVSFARGKLHGITQACGNRRFTRSGRFEKWRDKEGPGRPAEAVTGR